MHIGIIKLLLTAARFDTYVKNSRLPTTSAVSSAATTNEVSSEAFLKCHSFLVGLEVDSSRLEVEDRYEFSVMVTIYACRIY